MGKLFHTWGGQRRGVPSLYAKLRMTSKKAEKRWKTLKAKLRAEAVFVLNVCKCGGSGSW